MARTGSDSVVRQCIREGVAPVMIMGGISSSWIILVDYR